MDRTEFVDAVREETKTELSRLGSSKSLYADTEGEMESDPVLAAAADNAHYAAETFEDWSDGEAEETFTEAASCVRDHHDGIVGKFGSHEPGEVPAIVAFLREQETDVERLGGLVGWTLVAEEKAGQSSGFFTGQADPQTAGLFRGFRDDYEEMREEAEEALEAVCEGDDWDAAAAAATGAIEVAYDEYFETLEELGVNPKPVC